MYKFTVPDEPFAVGYINAGSDSKHISTGAGYIEMVKAAKISFDAETGLPDYNFGPMACPPSWSTGQSPNVAWLISKTDYQSEYADDYNYIIEKMQHLSLDKFWAEFTESEWDVARAGAGWGGTWGGHAVPDLIVFAVMGTDKMREKIACYRAKNPQADDFYEGLLLTLDAIDLLGRRTYDAAKAEYEKNPCPKLERLIKTFEKCPQKPAETFAEAVCVYQMINCLDGVDSPGHFDWFMIDFWNNSDYEESREALEDLWKFFHKTRIWNLCIGGSDENWNDKTNALTYEILEVARKYKYQTPNLTMRCHRNTPEALMLAAAETIGCGMGMPVLYNDEVVCPALESLGIPPCDSHLYVMNGCNQIDIHGKSHMGLEDGEVNVGLALKYAVFNGYSVKLGRQVGASTGEPEALDTFEKFYDAVKAQIMHLTDAVCSMSNKAQKSFATYTSNPIRSMSIEGCVEKGLDYKNSGPLYLHGQVLAEGVPELIDSLANIKKFVYEEKRFTLSEVRDALAANYEGYEKMQLVFKNSGLNFGNDIEYVDSIGKDIINFYNSYLRTKKTYRGGIFTGGCSPFNRAANNGYAAGAMPNGKLEGESLYGDSIGATPGRDVKGPTALLNSCLAFDHKLAGSGFILNLKFDKALFNSSAGITGFLALCKTYFGRGGQQLSVTVVSRQDLLDAVKNPDAHRNLIVRVGGFSEYFVNLTPELQQNVIARTNY